jgi:ABC-2 type transporter
MTTTTVTPIGLTPDLDLRGVRRFTTAVSDTFAVMVRNLIAYRRVPQLLIFSTIQPVVFVLLFRYVFGGAISVPGVPYVDFLMPGIFVQTVTFGALNTSIGLATDLNQGLIERFRSLPMARSAFLPDERSPTSSATSSWSRSCSQSGSRLDGACTPASCP